MESKVIREGVGKISKMHHGKCWNFTCGGIGLMNMNQIGIGHSRNSQDTTKALSLYMGEK